MIFQASSYISVMDSKLWMKVYFQLMFLIVLFSPISMEKLSKSYGVLNAVSSSGVKETFCMIYFSDLGSVAPTESVAESHILEDSSQINWCNDHPEIDPQNKVLLLSTDNNCTVYDEAINIQNRDGKGMIYIADGADIHIQNNKSEASSVNITVGYIGKVSKDILMKMDKPVKVTIFSPGERGFEYSLIILFVVAIFTICSGAYLSKGERYKFMQQKKSANKRRRSSSGRATDPPAGENRGKRFSILDEQVINVPAIYVFLLVLLMSGMLLLVYFFFDYLVYFMISMFTIASVGSIYFCLEPFVSKIPWNLKFNLRRCACDIKKVMLFAFALSIAIFWLIKRNHEYAWILQDVLGVFFSVHMLKTIRLGNMKMCTLILCLLFIYDIFFVFITPFLTKKGMSIMEEVARGENASEMVDLSKKVLGEMIPMVLKVIHLGYNSMSICYTEFSILGLGDILVPGLLVSYCMWFDEFTPKRKLYFWVSIVGYGVGMICTYFGLFLMATAQPALLYLVPCCLIPPVVVAYCQGELKAIWTGIIHVKGDSSTIGPVQEASTNVVPEEENATAEDQNSQEALKAAEISHDEKNHLIK